MENIKNKKWYDNVLWICIISYAILIISEIIGGLLTSILVKRLFTSGLIRGDVYIYTFIMYIFVFFEVPFPSSTLILTLSSRGVD